MEHFGLPFVPSTRLIGAAYPTKIELKKKYRALALEFHPDKNKDKAKATEIFKQVDNAYKELLRLYRLDNSFRYDDKVSDHDVENRYAVILINQPKVFKCLAVHISEIRGLKTDGKHMIECVLGGRSQTSSWCHISGGTGTIGVDFCFLDWEPEDYLHVIVYSHRVFRDNKRTCSSHIRISESTHFVGSVQLDHKDRKNGELSLGVKVVTEDYDETKKANADLLFGTHSSPDFYMTQKQSPPSLENASAKYAPSTPKTCSTAANSRLSNSMLSGYSNAIDSSLQSIRTSISERQSEVMDTPCVRLRRSVSFDCGEFLLPSDQERNRKYKVEGYGFRQKLKGKFRKMMKSDSSRDLTDNGDFEPFCFGYASFVNID